jgi:hypothetical protein
MFPKFIATASNFRTVSSLRTTIRGRLMLTSLSAESTSMRYTFATPPDPAKKEKKVPVTFGSRVWVCIRVQ